jgi:hypothetical protein
MWIIHLYLDTQKTQLFKILTFTRLADIAYCLNTRLHEVSNFYHGITKPAGIFRHLNIDRY